MADSDPRVDDLARRLDRQETRIDTISDAVTQLGRDIADTERRLSDEFRIGVDAVKEHIVQRLDKVDQHLDAQDTKIDRNGRQWPQGSLIAATAAITLVLYAILSAITTSLHW